MSNSSENVNRKEVNWGDLVLGLLALKGISETSKAIVNDNRKDTALEDFDDQDLGFFKGWQMESWFESHDFYVTKFPDTKKEIFPLAVKILYKLFKYHSKWYVDEWLGNEILNDCEKLNKLAIKKAIYPIAQNWPYWKLVQVEEIKENFWGNMKVKRKFFKNPEWNLETFFNSFAGGLIRFGLFGIRSDKGIDVCLYKKKLLGFGELTDAIELDEAEKTIHHVWDVKKKWNWVVKIYDPRHYDGPDKIDYHDVDKIPMASKRTLINPNTKEWRLAISQLKNAYSDRDKIGVTYNYRVSNLNEAIQLLTEASVIVKNPRYPNPDRFEDILIKRSESGNPYSGSDSNVKFGYEIHPAEVDGGGGTNDLPHIKFWDKRGKKETIKGHIYYN